MNILCHLYNSIWRMKHYKCTYTSPYLTFSMILLFMFSSNSIIISWLQESKACSSIFITFRGIKMLLIDDLTNELSMTWSWEPIGNLFHLPCTTVVLKPLLLIIHNKQLLPLQNIIFCWAKNGTSRSRTAISDSIFVALPLC